jgi:hypothetical protein
MPRYRTRYIVGNAPVHVLRGRGALLRIAALRARYGASPSQGDNATRARVRAINA